MRGRRGWPWEGEREGRERVGKSDDMCTYFNG